MKKKTLLFIGFASLSLLNMGCALTDGNPLASSCYNLVLVIGLFIFIIK